MAGGEQHAKQTLVDETERLSNDLRNGHAGDISKIGELLILVTKMMIPMYMNVFVTEEDCKKRSKTGKFSTIKIGPVTVHAPIMLIINLMPTGIMLFVLGKMQNWW